MTFTTLLESLTVCHVDAIAAEVERAFGPRSDGNPAWGEFDGMINRHFKAERRFWDSLPRTCQRG